MNTTQQIEIMKFETRLANRATAEGLRNWTPESRAASLATRRARGSVWGWDKRKRAIASTCVTEGFDRTMDAIEEDAPKIKREMEIYRSGGTTIGPRNKYADEVAAQRLESFKAWLAEVKRVEGAIDQFNGTVAALGGLTSGAAMARKGKTINQVSKDAVEKSISRKDKSIEKSQEAVLRSEKKAQQEIDRQRDSELSKESLDYPVPDYLSSFNPTAKPYKWWMVDQVPGTKTALEKSIRRNYEKRNADYLRQYPEDRGTMLDMVAEKAEYYSAQPARKVEIEKSAYRQIRDEGSTQMRETPPAGAKDYRTLLEAKRAAVREREIIRAQLKPNEEARPAGNGIWIGKMPDGQQRVIRAGSKPGMQSVNDDLLDAIEEARLGAGIGSGLIMNRHTSACASSKGEKCNCSCGGSQHGTEVGNTPGKEGEPAEPKDTSESAQPKGGEDPEASADFEGLVSSFKALIEKGEKPTLRTLQSQISEDTDGKKFKLSSAALAEAWHSYSLDKFQDKYERNPKNNFEFRTFQKKSGVPPEFIGGK
jgi:hypothetical protein